eukprot:10337875-Karenia_brevis.AAC.1
MQRDKASPEQYSAELVSKMRGACEPLLVCKRVRLQRAVNNVPIMTRPWDQQYQDTWPGQYGEYGP